MTKSTTADNNPPRFVAAVATLGLIIGSFYAIQWIADPVPDPILFSLGGVAFLFAMTVVNIAWQNLTGDLVWTFSVPSLAESMEQAREIQNND